ncbi:MAG TPA: LptF/LptG family permease [Vicinamibacterales bacterium]|nr:LptF/LptG family permease [Vicinamibacterales bacterium]
MLRTLDRYLLREILPPFFLALGVFTFALAVQPMLNYAQNLLAKNVPLPTVGFLLLTLLPQSLGVTIPMALLAGLLMALGRLSGDREAVALLACGVNPLRLLRPVLLFTVIVAAADLYVMVEAVPNGNQRFREVTFHLLTQQTDTDVKAGQFYEGFPGKVLYVRGNRPGGGWQGVFLADTSQPGRPSVTLAESAQLVLDSPRHEVDLWLYQARQYLPGADPTVYDTTETSEPLRIQIPADSVFGSGNLDRGLPEMSIADLEKLIDADRRAGGTARQAVMYLHQKFSFPAACLVFAMIGLALGLHTRKEGKLAGLTLGLVVIFVYYALLEVAEALTKGNHFSPVWARWVPNIALGVLGLWLLWKRERAAGAALAIPAAIDRFLQWLARPRVGSAAAGGGRRVVVVIRVPVLAVPRPRLLDVYVSAQYLRVAALAFAAFLGLYYIGTVIDLSDKVLKGQATAGILGQYLWYSTPQFIAYVVPTATLVAVLATIGGLTRSSELTVMRACGVSLYRAAVPLLALALVWSGLLFFLQERVIAQAQRKADALSDVIHGRPARTLDVENRNWLAGENGRLYYYLAYDPRRTTLYDASIFDTAPSPYRLTLHTHARRASFRPSDRAWLAEAGWVQRFQPRGGKMRESFTTRTVDFGDPANFSAAQVGADVMTFGELRAYIARLGASGFSVAEQRVNLQKKIAFPLVTLVMTLLGVPFGVTTGRRGALYGIGLALVLALGYWLLMTVFVAMGTAAILPAPLAAWAANVLFLAGAGYLMLTVRT